MIIIKTVGHGISFVIAGVTAIGYWAYNTVKKLILKISGWVSRKFKDEELVDIFNDFEDEPETDIFNDFEDEPCEA